MSSRARGGLEGWSVAGWIVAGLALVTVLQIAVVGTGEEGARLVVRTTGRVSTALFAAAFSASALVALHRSPLTAWLRRNRRALGVSFAGSQTIHLLGLAALARSAAFRQAVDLPTLLVGGIAFVFTYAMAATSSDAAVRQLGRSWRWLHRVGGWWIFVVLIVTEAPKAFAGPAQAVLSAALVTTLALRIVAWRRRPGSLRLDASPGFR